jgi:hypothetical protein
MGRAFVVSAEDYCRPISRRKKKKVGDRRSRTFLARARTARGVQKEGPTST